MPGSKDWKLRDPPPVCFLDYAFPFSIWEVGGIFLLKLLVAHLHLTGCTLCRS